jgi:aspartyl protease family protein
MRNLILFAILALVAAGIVPRFYGRATTGTSPTAESVQAPETAVSAVTTNRTMTIASENGHFRVDAEVDGRRLDFLVDTGASVIALREGDAARLGIHPSQREFTANVSTANGTVRGAPVELNRVEVGSLTVRNVAAIVLPDEALGQNLLGMSFLSKVRWEHRDGRLVLEQ